jgi:hypothetical protein
LQIYTIRTIHQKLQSIDKQCLGFRAYTSQVTKQKHVFRKDIEGEGKEIA